VIEQVCVQPTRASQGLKVAEVLADGVRRVSPRPGPHEWKVLRALLACRTGALGGTAYRCKHCHKRHVVAFGCGNRHCPDCQGRLAHQWLRKQQSRLLEACYFHWVFTLPHALNPLIRQNRRVLYDLLLEAASQTLLEFGQQRFKAQIGVTMLLHTWGQQLNEHYHAHAIVTGGGLTPDGTWTGAESPFYLFPIRAMSLVFRGKFCDGLQKLRQAGRLEYHGEQAPLAQERNFQEQVRTATAQRWVVYAKRPFAGPESVLRYLSNYTHRVAISSRRLLALDTTTHQIVFAYRDYADDGRLKVRALDTGEFTRRFCLHILPRGFCKIRHYGLLSNRARDQRLDRAREALARVRPPARAKASQPPPASTSPPPAPQPLCPFCGRSDLTVLHVTRRPIRRQTRFDSS